MSIVIQPLATPFDNPPEWAVLMRDLLARMPSAVSLVCEKYLADDGSVLWPQPGRARRGIIDGLDDAYESFNNWPLAWMLGADDSLLAHAKRGFEAVTRQFSGIPTPHGHPVVVNEYEQGYDWFHQGEGYALFYNLCAAEPGLAINRERCARFAGFLMNEGVPAPNYDFERLQFLSPHVGSMGAGMRNFACTSKSAHGLRKYYGLPFQTLPDGADPEAYFSDPGRASAYASMAAGRLSLGDCPTNLNSTSMATMAFLLTGQSRFKEWVLDHVNAWLDRAERNAGIIPDNVGPSGRVGELHGGDWFGGHYGWVWPHGWRSVGSSLTVALQNACLLTGDSRYPAVLRDHLRALADLGIEFENTLHIPYKRGRAGWYGYETSIPMLSQVLRESPERVLWKDGWFEFTPCESRFPAWLREMTWAPEDDDLFDRLRNRRTAEWNQVVPKPAKDRGGHEAAWTAYLRGEFPDYPRQILRHAHAQMDEILDFVEHDTQSVETYGDSYFQERNPVTVEALFQLTTGGSLPVYYGGLPRTRIRCYDTATGRSGLPRDVALRVNQLDAESVSLTAVNLSSTTQKTITLRAGFFGEYRFVGWRESDPAAGPLHFLPRTGNLEIPLPPRSEISVKLYTDLRVAPGERFGDPG